MAQILRPGGHIVVSVPGFRDRFAVIDEIAGHYRRYDPDDMRRLINDSGLRMTELVTTGAPIGYATEFLKNRMATRTLQQQKSEELSAHDRSMTSGRLMMPSYGSKTIEFASLPFRKIQGVFPARGTGVVALAEKPADL